MQTISGYTISEVVAEQRGVVTSRARRGGRSVLLRRPARERPSAHEVARLRYGAEVARGLRLPGVVRVEEIHRDRHGLVVELEDLGGQSLRKLLDAGPVDLDLSLSIAAGLARLLGEIHAAGVVHNDVEPANVLVHPAARDVKITGFELSSRLSRETATAASPSRLEGNLAYLSPERTGRMNRSVDHRSDLYSLGVVLYEMLTGRLPFDAGDPMTLVHGHIAVTPASPADVRPGVPRAVSAIVMKLLAKNAEDRYQSAYGLALDLAACQAAGGDPGPAFVPGARDVSASFHIPQKLYGRDQERRALIDAVDRASRGSTEAILLSGYSGIGKSALVNELQRPVAERRGYFVSGKFDQVQNVPYGAPIQAFTELVRQVLTESEERVASWRAWLLDALGPNGQVVIDVIPEVERIVGKQPPAPALPPAERQNRFNIVFQQFIGVFAREERPLVLFLDDLQWADSGSLSLLKLLVADQSSRHLLLVGAYRSNEVHPAHPLVLAIDELSKQSAALREIALQPLGLNEVSALIDDLLASPGGAASRDLAAIVHQKTGGNPFFIGQFLSSVHEAGLLTFDPNVGRWTFDLARIKALEVAADVAQLMAAKLHGLPESAKEALQLAACIGGTFDLRTLAVVSETSPQRASRSLWEAVEAGLVLPIGSSYKYVDLGEASGSTDADGPPSEQPTVEYEFLHDRVQEAAYAQLSEEARRAVHLRVGRLLLASTPAAQREARIFDIVNHLDLATALLDGPAERKEVARLNLIAGKRAKQSTAYAPAARYLKAGLDLLPEGAWRDDYELTFALHRHFAETEQLLGNHEQAEALLELLRREAASKADEKEITSLRMSLRSSSGNYVGVVQAGVLGLETFGVKLATGDAVQAAIDAEGAKLRAALAGRDIPGLAKAPAPEDPDERARLEILGDAVLYGAYAVPDMFQLLSMTLVNRSLEHGNAMGSAAGYMTYGMLVGAGAGDHASAHALGKVALAVSEEHDARHVQCVIQFFFGAFVNPWRSPIATTIPIIDRAYVGCLESGSAAYAGFSTMQGIWMRWLRGEDLRSLHDRAVAGRALVQRMNQRDVVHFIGCFVRAIALLSGRKLSPEEAARLDPKFLMDQLPHYGAALFCLYASSLLVSFVMGETEEARRWLAKAEETLLAMFGHVGGEPEVRFYKALLLADLHASEAPEERERTRKLLDEDAEKLRVLAGHCPENFGHKHLLVLAEIARVDGRDDEATTLYDRAIGAAAEAEFLGIEALASELCAKHHLAKGRRRIARAYMTDARDAYARWGADAKVAAMEKRHPDLLTAAGASSGASGDGVPLDLVTVMKASQAISQEIVLGDLLRSLMTTLLENAGAQRGFLILTGESPLVVEASAGGHEGAKVVVHTTPLDARDDLAKVIVRYVERTHESVVLADASRSGRFQSDPYVAAAKPRSILCTSVLKQKKLIGILYLENNLVGSAFTPERCKILELLAAQAAISLENAKLYDTLENRVKLRTQELSASNAELSLALERVRQTQQQLVVQEKLAALGALTSGIAHEIKNPLNFVLNFSEATVDLADELIEEAGREGGAPQVAEVAGEIQANAVKIRDHGRRVDAIVKAMLSHAQTGPGERREVDMKELVAEYVRATYEGLRARDPSLDVAIELVAGEGPLTAHVVSPEIGRVLLNLVNNACHAVQAKKRRLGDAFSPKITVSTRAAGPEVEIRIRDNGIGIPAAVQEKIFTPFFTTKPAGEGCGLGLSISHDVIVQGHGGSLRFESEEGEYTEFTIALPR